MKKVALVSLGCAKNLVDSEMILAMFEHGYEITKDLGEADIIILNTCAFIEAARTESLEALERLKGYRKAKLVVTGCLSQRYKDDLKDKYPDVLFVSIDEYKDLDSLLLSVAGEGEINPIDPLRREYATAPYFAYLRISEGCNHFCAFCAIPYIRGRYKSRPFDEVIEEAKKLLALGKKEIAVISQDPAAYGLDFPAKKPDFCDLLEELDSLGFYKIRLLYLYPSELDERFVSLVKNSKSIAHYFDIPVQSGSEHVLKLMNRKDTVEGNLRLIHSLRDAMPEATFRTTLIAGFPGETEEDVEETLDFLEKARFDHVGAFSYSKEEGTAAAKMKGHLEEEEKLRRLNLYMEKGREISLELNQKRIGTAMEGIVISKGNNPGELFIRSDWNAPDEIDGDILVKDAYGLKEGDIVKVIIEKAGPHRLIAKPL